MEFTREVHEQYQKAYAMASSCQQKNKKHSLPVFPVSLDSFLTEGMVSYKQDLGIMEIPTNFIVGVAEKNDLMLSFTKEFLPAALPNSGMAEQWRLVYRELLDEKRIHAPIICLEYLGKFYVSEGLIQVSVAKFADIPVMQSKVIRVMPNKTDSREVKQYFDFLAQYKLTDLYQIQFTQPGFFEEMEKAFGKNPAEKWSDSDRSVFLKIWPKVETAFRNSYSDCLPITAADAFVILLRKYSCRQLMQMDTWILARIFQASWKDLYSLNGADSRPTPKHGHSKALQTA